MVEAFARLQRELPATRLILVGEAEAALDPLREKTQRSIAENPAIEAVGRQSDVRPWLAAADAFVFPSYREGFPNVVIEAGAMGLPSIVTDINGSREIIRERENGLIIPPRDAESLYRAMKQMAEDSVVREKMAAKARPLIATRYEQTYVRRCLKEYYAQILQK